MYLLYILVNFYCSILDKINDDDDDDDDVVVVVVVTFDLAPVLLLLAE